MLSLADLGVLRDVDVVADSHVVVDITPTYSGCPAMAAMRDDLVRELTGAGFDRVEVRVSLHPAWTTDWITPAGRAALAAAGISPPGPAPSTERARSRCPCCRPHARCAARSAARPPPSWSRSSAPRPARRSTAAPSASSRSTTSRRSEWRPSPSTPLTVRDVEPLTDDSAAVTFDVPDDLRELFDFEPGESLTLRRVVDGVEHRRTYSICAPAGAAPRIGVREIPDGMFSSWLIHQVAPGETVEVAEPSGSFRADPSSPGRHLCIAAGSGITPMLSIAASVLAEPGQHGDDALRQPRDDVGDVRRGAQRPQEPPRTALRPRPRALARAARRRALLRPARRRQAPPAAAGQGAARRGRPRLAVRPAGADPGRADRPRGARRRRRRRSTSSCSSSTSRRRRCATRTAWSRA